MIVLVRFLAAASIIATLTGCVTSLSPAQRGSMQRIGIMPLMSDEMKVQYAGPIWDRHFDKVPLPAGPLNSALADPLALALRKEGKHAVALYDHTGMIRLRAERSGLQKLTIGRQFDYGKLSEQARRMAAAHRLDTVVFFEPYLPSGHELLPPAGFGIYGGPVTSKEQAVLFIYAVLRIEDLRTGKTVIRRFDPAFRPVEFDWKLWIKEKKIPNLEKLLDQLLELAVVDSLTLANDVGLIHLKELDGPAGADR